MTTEETKIVTMPLPFGQDWCWYPDLNIIALSNQLDAAGRERALDEFLASWRHSLMQAAAGSSEPELT
jgi:hypothetical protein